MTAYLFLQSAVWALLATLFTLLSTIPGRDNFVRQHQGAFSAWIVFCIAQAAWPAYLLLT